ncbi:MAG: adenosylcobinamide-GDP ribazoletransferase [Nanoarchaeota archaeon]
MITLAVALVMFPLWHFTGLVVMLGVWIMAVVMAVIFKRKFAGLTGDNYGAINEVAEVIVLILVVLLARIGLAW